MSRLRTHKFALDSILIRKGQSVYDRQIRVLLERDHIGEFVAIEPDSGRYFLGPSATAALVAARGAMPESQFYLTRVGRSAAHKIGGVAQVLGEAQRRYQAFLKGQLEASPGDAVMSRARNSLK